MKRDSGYFVSPANNRWSRKNIQSPLFLKFACGTKCRGRKNLLISQSKLRTPAIFSWGAIVSDQNKIAGVLIKT
jgi:hypothetical protein